MKTDNWRHTVLVRLRLYTSFAVVAGICMSSMPEPIASAAPSPPELSPQVEYSMSFINGLWESDWGPLTLIASLGPNGTFNLTGYWILGGAKGIIQKGNFDPASGVLHFTYYQDWNQVNGQAAFGLSADKRVLNGNWSQSDGRRGGWTLTRANSWRLAAPPPVKPPQTDSANLKSEVGFVDNDLLLKSLSEQKAATAIDNAILEECKSQNLRRWTFDESEKSSAVDITNSVIKRINHW